MMKDKKEDMLCFICKRYISSHTPKDIKECSDILIDKANEALKASERLLELVKELMRKKG